jgi:uncharacterized membrane protein YkvA (DUF1232 family)
LFLAWKDPLTPVLAKIITILAVAYAVSPIDLIPDFIPVLGQLDDLLILPVLILLALALIPPEVSTRCRREAWKHLASGDRIRTPAAIVAAILIALVWLGTAYVILRTFF